MSYKDSPITRAECDAITRKFDIGMICKEDMERMVDAPPVGDNIGDDETDFTTGVSQRKDLMCLFWVGKLRRASYLYKRDNSDFKKQMKLWRQQAVKGIIKIHDENCKDIEYKGRKYYGFTLSIYEDGEITRCPDPLSLMLFGYMCDGITYWMTAKTNRDMIVKYIMKDIEVQPLSEGW